MPATARLALVVAAAPALDGATSRVEVSTGVSAAEWDAFVDGHEGASRYHAWAWRAVFEEAFGHDTVYLAATDAGEVVGILPLVIMRSRIFGRFAVSLPFVDGGGVCARDTRVAHLLVDRARGIAAERRLSHVELRHDVRQLPALPARQHKVGMSLTLAPSAELAWAALDRKVRNQVRKAEKSGLLARQGGIELLDAFYEVFARNMRDLGTPVYSRRFFHEVVTRFPDTSTIFLVEHGARPVAAGIALRHQRTVAVPWASSLREYRVQCPNVLMYWRILEAAVAAGMSRFDFGRSTPGEGTFQFKQQWGAQPSPLHWEYVLSQGASPPNLTTKNPRFELAIAAWKRMPLAVTRWLGPHIVRSIP